jgi:lipid A 4'-phosphatase
MVQEPCMIDYFKKNSKWLIPILLLAALTPFTPYLDLEIARHFYRQGTPADPFSQNQILKLIYFYGPVPGQIALILGITGFLFSYLFDKCRHWRPFTLYLVLTLAVGAGLITHIMLKDHWGRPRPRQVIEFGGEQKFRPYYKPNLFHQPEPSKSFPCGHSTMGFFFLTLVVTGQRFEKKWLFYLGIALTVVLSVSLSYARIAQGGHFLSDVLLAGIIMWITALLIGKLTFRQHS